MAAPPLNFISRYNLCSHIKTHLQSSTSINPSTKSRHHDDDGSIRKQPIFPGAIAINTEDLSTCINQTGQTAPANALLGKPSKSKCKHGYTQVFSLDPMPSNKFGMDRLNSGLIKLTCPLLVNGIDVMEDDKFMNEINDKLIADNEENELVECMNDAHKVHAETRKELIFGDDNSDSIEENDSYKLLESKLGERGAKYFIEAGVAGANTLSKKVDVKCLHAWLGDYLMRSDTIAEHPIGDMIANELEKRGISISGTDDCHAVCSGCSADTSTSVQVPIPRNRQRKKRRQIQLNDNQ